MIQKKYFRTDDVELKNLTVDGDLIIGCGAADGKIVLDNVTVKGRLLVWDDVLNRSLELSSMV